MTFHLPKQSAEQIAENLAKAAESRRLYALEQSVLFQEAGHEQTRLYLTEKFAEIGVVLNVPRKRFTPIRAKIFFNSLVEDKREALESAFGSKGISGWIAANKTKSCDKQNWLDVAEQAFVSIQNGFAVAKVSKNNTASNNEIE